MLRNPLLYHEGWGVDAIKHSVVYSGGLSRGYVRTYAPAAMYGFDAFSPFTTRSVIAAAVAIPFDRMVDGRTERLTALKQDLVSRGVRRVLGIEMPVNPKRRFQDGARPRPEASAGQVGVAQRVSKSWCRMVFSRYWDERLRNTPDALDRRSGHDLAVTELSPFV